MSPKKSNTKPTRQFRLPNQQRASDIPAKHSKIPRSQLANEDLVNWGRYWPFPINLPGEHPRAAVRMWPPSAIVISLGVVRALLHSDANCKWVKTASPISFQTHFNTMVAFFKPLDPGYWKVASESAQIALTHLRMRNESTLESAELKSIVRKMRSWYLYAGILELLGVIQQTSHNANFSATRSILKGVKEILLSNGVSTSRIAVALNVLHEDMQRFLRECLTALQSGNKSADRPYIKSEMNKLTFEQKLVAALDYMAVPMYLRLDDKKIVLQADLGLLANVYTSLLSTFMLKKVGQMEGGERLKAILSTIRATSTEEDQSTESAQTPQNPMFDAAYSNDRVNGHGCFAPNQLLVDQHDMTTWHSHAIVNPLSSSNHYVTRSGLHVYNQLPQHSHHAVVGHEHEDRNYWSPQELIGHGPLTENMNPYTEPFAAENLPANSLAIRPPRPISTSHTMKHNDTAMPMRPTSHTSGSFTHVQHPSAYAPGPHYHHAPGSDCLSVQLKQRDAHAKPVLTRNPEMDALDDDPDWNYFKDQHR